MSQPYIKNSFNYAAALSLSGVECVRGDNRLFSDLGFEAEPGAAIKIVGENGSGKTSLLRIIAGLSQPERGSITWNGDDISDESLNYRMVMTYLGHKIGLKENLTVHENLTLLGHLEDAESAITVTDSLRFIDMESYLCDPVLQLSAGQRQRVGLARVLRSNAQLWLLDEPATALDSKGISLLEKYMIVHLDAGGIVIYSSHQTLELGNNNNQQINLH